MNEKRKFSVAFPCIEGNETVDDVVSYFGQYKDNIENMYLGIPSLGNNYHNITYHLKGRKMDKSIEEYERECIEFLEKSRGLFKRLITLNSGCYNMSQEDLCTYVNEKLVPFFRQYAVDGCICTDFNMAMLLHEAMPELELHSSCNSYIETKREMDLWHDWAGITVFNPPREFLRIPYKLKEMRESGYRLKYLVNESCLFGCPQSKNHLMAQAVNNLGFASHCYHCEEGNFLRSVCVVPRWLDRLDPYVDIYKISGRMCSFASVKRTFEAYFYEQDDIDMGMITYGSGSRTFKSIVASDFPDKLLECECKDCKTCGLCDRIVAKRSHAVYYKSDYTDEEYKSMIETFENLSSFSGQKLEYGSDRFGEYFRLTGLEQEN